MTTTIDATITVDTGDLRRALNAVLPHAEPNKTGDLDSEHRIRLIFDDAHINVLASNGATCALAIVSIEDDSRAERFAADDGPIHVDITPRDGRHMLWLFKAKATDPDGVEQQLELHITTEHLEVTDVSGLLVGHTIRIPQLDLSSQFPDVMGVIARAFRGIGASQIGKPLIADGRTLKLFQAASTAYDQPLQVEATGTPESRGFVISCGESFLGTVSSRHQDDDSLARREAWRNGWLNRLPDSKLQAV